MMNLEEQIIFIKQQYTAAMVVAQKTGAPLEEQIAQRALAQSFFDVSISLKTIQRIREMVE